MSKIIGFQVVKNGTIDLHPKMGASFCVYSIPQCMAMLINDTKEVRDNYTIETVREGEIEEPTIMFKGNPMTAEINLLITKK